MRSMASAVLREGGSGLMVCWICRKTKEPSRQRDRILGLVSPDRVSPGGRRLTHPEIESGLNESLWAARPEAKMKKHTTDQIIRKLREAEALSSQGKGTAEICQALEISGPDVLPLEIAVRTAGQGRVAPSAEAGGGESAAEEAGRRPGARSSDSEGGHQRKMVGAVASVKRSASRSASWASPSDVPAKPLRSGGPLSGTSRRSARSRADCWHGSSKSTACPSTSAATTDRS